MIQLICASFKEWDKKCGLNCVNEKKLTKTLEGPFSHNVWWIIFIIDSIISYDDANNLFKLQKNGIKSVEFIALTTTKNNQIFKEPFFHNIWWIFVIFNRVNPYSDTNDLCEFQKNWIKDGDFIS